METDRVSPAQWGAVAQKRIMFGHQSVGDDILAGVQSLAQRAGIELKVTELRGAAQEPGITHFRIGRNEEPQSKLSDFIDTLASGSGEGADVALMKLCYVDFKSDTDAKKIAWEYCASLESLSRQFPKTTFVAVTAPLTTVQSGPKAWLKRLVGRRAAGYAENFRRHEFNSIIRDGYGVRGRLFDLAKIEAEGSPDYSYNGGALEVLNPRFTSDGGHLNALGKQIVAARLIRLIAALPEQRQ
jgi:hypothetical protein